MRLLLIGLFLFSSVAFCRQELCGAFEGQGSSTTLTICEGFNYQTNHCVGPKYTIIDQAGNIIAKPTSYRFYSCRWGTIIGGQFKIEAGL